MRTTLFLALLLPASTGGASDYKSLTDPRHEVARPHGNLDVRARRFGILRGMDVQRQRVALLLDGETEPREWPLRAGAEVWYAGWWGRLDQFTIGDRVWVWFDFGPAKEFVAVGLLADELSEQDLYAPGRIKAVKADGTVLLESLRGGKPTLRTVSLAQAELFRGDVKAPHDSLKVGETVHVQTTGAGADARLLLDAAAFERRQAAQKAALRRRWADEGLPGTLIFTHPEQREVEVILDHEALRWGRSLEAGAHVTLQVAKGIPATVRRIRPWRERTQVLLQLEGSDATLRVGERVSLRAVAPPARDDDDLPAGLGKSENKAERVDWLMSGLYCTCGMHDGCAGHFYTLAACNATEEPPCGLAKRTRAAIADMIDKGHTDRQIFEVLLKERGPKLLRPHLLP
jgi:hypothetical protein